MDRLGRINAVSECVNDWSNYGRRIGTAEFVSILRRATGLIKAIGAWMMMMAGIALIFYLTQPELIASWL